MSSGSFRSVPSGVADAFRGEQPKNTSPHTGASKAKPDIVNESFAFDKTDEGQPGIAQPCTNESVVPKSLGVSDTTSKIDARQGTTLGEGIKGESTDFVIPNGEHAQQVEAPSQGNAVSEEENRLEHPVAQQTFPQKCMEYASDTAATQENPEDAGCLPDRCSLVEEVEGIQMLEAADVFDEISPTLPFKAEARQDHGNLEIEISPTLPFEPVLHQERTSETSNGEDSRAVPPRHDVEISHTLAFEVKIGLSTLDPTAAAAPTAPAEASVATSAAPASASAPAAPEEHKEHAAAEPKRLDPPEDRNRGRKRSASQSVSEDEGHEGDDTADPHETAENRKRHLREREWLQHKKRALQKEIGKQKDQAKEARKSARKVQRAVALGTATMNGEDAAKFAAVVSDNFAATAVAQLSDKATDDDDLIPDQRRRAPIRKRSVFTGSNAGGA